MLRSASPMVSVIIANYNYGRYIGQALRSVAAQNYDDWELIVVDDGSTDDSRRVVLESGVPCRYFYQQNRGAASARNRGLEEARGEYINFLDADDLLLPGKLALQVAYMEDHPEVAVVYGDTTYFYEDGSQRPERSFSRGLRTPPFLESGTIFGALVINSLFSTNAALSRREALLEIGGFDESLLAAEDYDLWLRMAKRYRFAYLDVPVARYRIHGGNKVFSMPEKRLQALERIWDKVVHSDAFIRLPKRVRSNFYLRVATEYTLNDRAEKARSAARKAFQHDPLHLTAFFFVLALLPGASLLRALLEYRRRRIRKMGLGSK